MGNKVIGVSGQGMTYNAKLEVIRAMEKYDGNVVMLDPENEFTELSDSPGAVSLTLPPELIGGRKNANVFVLGKPGGGHEFSYPAVSDKEKKGVGGD